MVNSSKFKFSVVTVVYNGQEYIEKTIQNVLSLDYDNYEYIIIDGASSDSTFSIIEKYINRIDYFISENDLGLYDAMNKGLDYCTGDYVIFMNGGDRFCDSNILSKVNQILLQENVEFDFIYGDSYVQSNGSSDIFYKKSRSCKYSWYGMFTNHQSMFYKVDLVNRYKLKFDINLKISADYKFTVQFLSLSKASLYLNIPVCVYLLGGLSIVNRDLGLYEADKVRKEVMDYNLLHRKFIKFLIYSSRFVEDYFSGIHKLLRYK